jgi:hypothetical protein
MCYFRRVTGIFTRIIQNMYHQYVLYEECQKCKHNVNIIVQTWTCVSRIEVFEHKDANWFHYFKCKCAKGWQNLLTSKCWGEWKVFKMAVCADVNIHLLSRTGTTKVADVVYVNCVIWTMGCERVRGQSKGWAAVGRPETRVDGYSSPREKKLVLQVKQGCHGMQGVRLGRGYMPSKYCNIWLKINHLWDTWATCA